LRELSIGSINRRVATESARSPALRQPMSYQLKSARSHIWNINPHNELPAIFEAYHFVPQNRPKKMMVFVDFVF